MKIGSIISVTIISILLLIIVIILLFSNHNSTGNIISSNNSATQQNSLTNNIASITNQEQGGYVSPIAGLRYTFYPPNGPINANVNLFQANITSFYNTLLDCKLQLINASNTSQILASQTNLVNSSFCSPTINYSPTDNTSFFANISVSTTNSNGFITLESG